MGSVKLTCRSRDEPVTLNCNGQGQKRWQRHNERGYQQPPEKEQKPMLLSELADEDIEEMLDKELLKIIINSLKAMRKTYSGSVK